MYLTREEGHFMRLTGIVLVFVGLSMLFSCADPVLSPPPNVLVIVIDSLRARNLSCYGYERNTTPAIDSLAAEGTLWANCISQSSWTLPSMTSMLTGLTVRSHGAGRRDDTEFMLHPEAPFLPNLARDRGYRTYGHFNVIYLDGDHGFSRGFDTFHCERETEASAGVVVDGFSDWLGSLEDGEKFFAVLHLFDPHMPYDPPAPFNTMFGPLADPFRTRWLASEEGEILDPENRHHYMSLYDGEIAYTDMEVGRLLARLRREGLAENTIVVVVADHGEEFLEHGRTFHGHAFYQEVVHVPMIISGPGVPRGVVDSSWVGLFDLSPTILGLLSSEPDPLIEGVDVLAYAHGSRAIPSNGLFDPPSRQPEPWVCSVVIDGVKTLRLDTDSAYTDLTTDLRTDRLERNYTAATLLSADVDAYLLKPRLWEPISVERDMAASSILRDLGYF